MPPAKDSVGRTKVNECVLTAPNHIALIRKVSGSVMKYNTRFTFFVHWMCYTMSAMLMPLDIEESIEVLLSTFPCQILRGAFDQAHMCLLGLEGVRIFKASFKPCSPYSIFLPDEDNIAVLY